MLRATLLCLLVAIVALVGETSGIDVRGRDKERDNQLNRLVLKQPYSKDLEKVRRAAKEALSNLLDKQTNVTDPNFHRGLVLGQVDATANHVLAGIFLEPEDVYVLSLNVDLPLVYKAPQDADQNVKKDFEEIKLALEPVVKLVNKSCQGLDEKDCDTVVQATLDGTNDDDLLKSARTLKLAAATADSYFLLTEDAEKAARHLSGLGFLLNYDSRLYTLAHNLSLTLLSARSPVKQN